MNVQPSTRARVRRAPRLRAFALVAALAAPPALAGCASAGPNKGQLNLVSLQEEWQLGQQLHRDISRQMPVDQDPEVVRYVNQIGQRLASTTYYRELPWNFHVVDDPAINAFNIPGGHIYVNSGLIRATDNAAELSSVIGHELAHGLARHGTENLTKQYGLGIVASLLLGNNPPLYQQLLAQIVGGGVLAKYSRDAEREADRLGIQAMYDSGYDPHGAVTMFQELLAARKNRPSGLEQFFSSHPITEERITNARAQIATLPPKPNLIVDDGRFDTIKARLAAR